MIMGRGQNNSFANIKSDTDTAFIPGQNISVQAVAYNTVWITNIASSDIEITNSLFESNSLEGGLLTAKINNIRHLENLDKSISGLASIYIPAKAVQTSDISWDTFKTNIAETSTDDRFLYHRKGRCEGHKKVL